MHYSSQCGIALWDMLLFGAIVKCVYIHCVPKKTVVPNFGDNFVKSLSISKIFALL